MVMNAALARQVADEASGKLVKDLKEKSLKRVLELINYEASDGLYETTYYPDYKNEKVIEFIKNELIDLNYTVGSLENGLKISWY